MLQERLSESAIGVLIGCGIGDAVGELAFTLRDRNDLMATAAHRPVIRYTDDTAMMIAVAEALVETGDIEPEDLGSRFARHYAAEPWRGYGPGPPKIFDEAARTGVGYVSVARNLYGGAGSFGNGAAMRVAPVGVAFHEDPNAVDEAARRSAMPTHAHPVGQDGAAVQAMAVALATGHHILDRTLDARHTAVRLRETAKTDAIREKMDIVVSALDGDWSPMATADAIGRSIAVAESMPFAVYAFLRSPEDSLNCQDIAVLNGGDRDTLGAMAMAISGAYLGPAGLRKVLTNRLERRDDLRALGERLATRFPARRSGAGA